MNQVMKLLTVMSSIFIPLTFVAGIYGMNFEYMPELHWVWGYPVVLAAMLTLAVSLTIFFRRKHWI
jgi:magnesium transporter